MRDRHRTWKEERKAKEGGSKIDRSMTSMGGRHTVRGRTECPIKFLQQYCLMSSSPEDGGFAAFSAPPKCATYVPATPTFDYTLTLSFLISTIVLTLKFSRLPYHLCRLLILLTLIKPLLRYFFSRILQLQY